MRPAKGARENEQGGGGTGDEWSLGFHGGLFYTTHGNKSTVEIAERLDRTVTIPKSLRSGLVIFRFIFFFFF